MTKLKEYKMFINGEWVESESKKTFETLNPENNEPWAIVPEASSKDVDKLFKPHNKPSRVNGLNYFQEKELSF